jgi:2-oxoglutarate ferredoxin oxidoreductase subunit gamma
MLLKSVFSGFGGQGVLMMGYVLAFAGMEEGRHVTFLPAYGAEMRGGTANCTVVVSDSEIASPIASNPDFATVMNHPSLIKYQHSVKSGGFVFMNSDLISAGPARRDVTVVKVPANTLAHEMGADRSLNMVMLGAVVEVTRAVAAASLAHAVETVLEGKKRSIIEQNQQALVRGAEFISAGR